MTESPESREYESLEKALQAWPVHKDRPEVWSEIHEVIEKVAGRLGDVIKVHIPQAESYIAVTFAKEPTKIGAYVGAGRVDHIVEVAGSYVPEAAPAYWRSELSTVGVSAALGSRGETVDHVTCPNGCGLKIAKTAECSCGWRFNQNS